MTGERLVQSYQIVTEHLADPSNIPAASSGDILYATKMAAIDKKAKRQAAFITSGFDMLSDEVTDDKCIGLTTPTDPETGLVLPIRLIDPPYKNADTSFVDYHHHYHSERRYAVNDAVSALRMTRGQDMPRWLHEHYHRFFEGTRLPRSREETFTTSVLACAGVIPSLAIDFSKGDGPRLRQVSRDEYAVIARSTRREGMQRDDLGRFQRNKIGIFFANYTVDHCASGGLASYVIDEFLETKNSETRIKLGNKILREALGVALDPVRPIFHKMRKQDLLVNSETDPFPVVRSYFVDDRMPDYHVALASKLKATA